MPSKKKRGKQAAAAAAVPKNNDKLVQAALRGDWEDVARLLKNGADPNASVMRGKDASGREFEATALRAAAAGGNLEAAPGLGRIVVSEIDIPTMLVNLV
jgi:hypothetical protein